jgi:polysaccharide pyruvyl transferase WcaK-like protein
MNPRTNVMVLGFFNRQNMGDDTYTIVFSQLFNNCDVSYKSLDDVHDMSTINTDILIIGGGDIINDYFMTKLQYLLKNYVGRVYGISVGIPYASCSHYLHIFDHVFVRSMEDYRIASLEIGAKNVSYTPDISVILRYILRVQPPRIPITVKKHVAICLAQPLFYNNPRKTQLITDLSSTLIDFAKKYNVMYHIMAFNYNVNSNQECDHIINTQVIKHLQDNNILYQVHHDIQSPIDMIIFLHQKIDMCLCMRYHSVMFSIIANIPFVPLYVSQKISNVLKDIQYDNSKSYLIDYDDKYRPRSIDKNKLLSCFENVYNSRGISNNNFMINNQWEHYIRNIRQVILNEQPYINPISRMKLNSFNDVLIKCKNSLCKFLDILPLEYESILHKTGKIEHNVKSSMDIARLICFTITGQMNHPCIWGLAENINKDDFCLFDAIKYIYDDVNDTFNSQEITYYPYLNNFERKILINVDFVFSNDYSRYHRSGWSYAIGGLMHLDAPTLMKQSDIFIDTYVDRSFHWNKEIMKTIGEIPYTKPWYGFIHHTFDTTHSNFNCDTLLKDSDFLISLETCKGLIVLTKYLKKQLDDEFIKINKNISVHVLYHPMEFVEDNFTLQKFINNPNKKIVQIGAWLRNPYAIYEFKLSDYCTNLQKAHLRGNEMDMYFAPPNYIEKMQTILFNDEWLVQNNDDNSICRPVNICRPIDICRPNINYIANKYYLGAFERLCNDYNSVEIIPKLNNQQYDKLLSENIVFLNLVDCSAVNTVIECIVRNTVLIVNRLEPLEEILGKNYPGFYTDLKEASDFCTNMNKISHIHNYLKSLDKSRYNLDTFVEEFQNIILNKESSRAYPLFETSNFQLILPSSFSEFFRFLPSRYTPSIFNL